ncbi:MAG: hypothetical protein IJN84_06710 [Clostridia bacterium]|nr:hypothetical protein [Clostridia bacterium]
MRDKIKAVLSEMEPVYALALRGDPSAFRFEGGFSPELGMVDKNRKTRLKLAYYMLFAPEQEEIVASFLFSEEVKAIKSLNETEVNDCIEVLTFILQKYNSDRRYNILFDRLLKNRLGHFENYDIYKEQKMLDDYSDSELAELYEKLK